MKPYLTVNEVSEQIPRSPQRLREDIAKGTLRAVQFKKPRGRFYITPKSLEDYLRAHEVSPSATGGIA